MSCQNIVLIRYSFAEKGMCRAKKQREKVAATRPRLGVEVENRLHGIGWRRDGEKGLVDEGTCPLSLELMKQ